VLRGIKKDDRSWCVIYTIDESDNWEDYNCWVKANPNLGVSVFDDFLRGQYDAAIASAGEQNNIKCKHLNVRLEDIGCPQCGTSFKYIAFQSVREHLPKLLRISQERSGVQFVDYQDFKRIEGEQKARSILG
jgi:phage terminase large subunit-like protein